MEDQELQERLERIPDIGDRALAREFVSADPIDQRIDLFLGMQATRSEVSGLRDEFRAAMGELPSGSPWRAQISGFGYTTLGIAGLAVATLKGWFPDSH